MFVALWVAFIIDQVLVIDNHGRQVLLQFELETCIIRCASWGLSEGITSYIDHIDALSKSQEPQVTLSVNDIEWKIELLQLHEIIVLVKHLRVELSKSIPAQIQSFQPFDLSKRFEQNRWATNLWHWRKCIWRKV